MWNDEWFCDGNSPFLSQVSLRPIVQHTFDLWHYRLHIIVGAIPHGTKNPTLYLKLLYRDITTNHFFWIPFLPNLHKLRFTHIQLETTFFELLYDINRYWRRCQIWANVNPRPDGGGLKPPFLFFFAYLISHPFRTFPENFVPRSSQVRSSGLTPKKFVALQ